MTKPITGKWEKETTLSDFPRTAAPLKLQSEFTVKVSYDPVEFFNKPMVIRSDVVVEIPFYLFPLGRQSYTVHRIKDATITMTTERLD